MKLRTLFYCTLFALTANCQTKETSFKKIENLLKKSNGSSVMGAKIGGYVFSENSVSIELAEGGNSEKYVFSKMAWKAFEYDIDVVEEDKKISKLTLSFDEEFDMLTYENNKKSEPDETQEIPLFINTTDAKAIEQELRALQLYTWKELQQISIASKTELTAFITKKLNPAITDDGAKVKSITECEITFAYSDEEIIIPTKIYDIHFQSSDYNFCYGKKKGLIKTKTRSGLSSDYEEHPDIDMEFKEMNDVTLLKIAIKRLSDLCNL